MASPKSIQELVKKFDENIDAYKSNAYNEAQVRQEFINPMFKALGWDMDNTQGYAEAYKDVIHEDAIRIAGATKAPDYCFRIGGTRKFFLEAKKPSINLNESVEAAYQLKRYAWSANLPLSILTDFEELVIYDCRKKPLPDDKPSKSRIFYLKYTDYFDKWDEIASVFSRESILKGSFDKFAETSARKHGTAQVDDAFLEEIESWREKLARNIALRNPKLTQRELNYCVQITIDRIIFLRICEDRKIESYGRLQALQNGANIYRRLLHLFDNADERYNSGLFYFGEEKGRPGSPDTITPKIKIDDKPLKDIIIRLYYPESPYEFSVLPADILGQVYEQFLGKIIRLTAGHQARVEEKPEVRKAGGVYYTPKFVVDYIVQNTIGKLLEGKNPGPRGSASKLKILDPACGSGSFLLGAYQFLLDWYLSQYISDDPQKWARGKNPVIAANRQGAWRLTTSERKRILLANIYGVDIDPQAVEVTKLSLLLKVLEGEDAETINLNLASYHQRALPDLGGNIKCGNSLIGTDFYSIQALDLFGEEDTYKINAFDWKMEFPEIMSSGGFSIIMGNPPYGAEHDIRTKEYLKAIYQSCRKADDSFILFMEKSSLLLRDSGLFGMIVQSAWVSAPTMFPLRELFSKSFLPHSFVTMPYDVFGAYIDTIIVIAQKTKPRYSLLNRVNAYVDLVVFPTKEKIKSVDDFETYKISADAAKWTKSPGLEYLVTLSNIEQDIIIKLNSKSSKLSEFMDIQRGVTPFDTFDHRPGKNPFPAFVGTVRRYRLDNPDKAYIRYDESLAEYKPERYFIGPRLLLREMISRQFRLQATYADERYITNKSMQSLLLLDTNYNIFYFLGLINSRLLSWYFLSSQSVGRRDDFPKIVLKQTRELPVKKINFSNENEIQMHDCIAENARNIVSLQAKLKEVKLEHEKLSLGRRIEKLDKQIDSFVFRLYGLSTKEIDLIESKVN